MRLAITSMIQIEFGNNGAPYLSAGLMTISSSFFKECTVSRYLLISLDSF